LLKAYNTLIARKGNGSLAAATYVCTLAFVAQFEAMDMKNLKYITAVALALAFLAGCAGVGQSPLPQAASVPQNGASAMRATPDGTAFTVASGRVVADPSGAPMAGVAVNLYLWTPCTVVRKPGLRNFVCPKPVATTKTGGDGRFRLRARPGHYLLAIGSDDPTDIVHPTVHDNVTLAGASQRLLAPGPCPGTPPQSVGPHCMPTFPTVTATVPEKSGDYRLATLDSHEVPCAKAFNVQRTALGLEPAVVDEWLTENTRGEVGDRINPKVEPFLKYVVLSTGQIAADGGDNKPVDGVSACGYYLVPGAFASAFPIEQKYALDPRTHWMSARWVLFTPPHSVTQGYGLVQYPRDPRNFQDPKVKYWP
jgi:hypothetical protein